MPQRDSRRHNSANDPKVSNLRGTGLDVLRMEAWLRRRTETYALIIVDPLYRTYPDEFNENSNRDMTAVYDVLTRSAAAAEASIVVVHHQSKGGQADKDVSDVGAGAGAQSRAAGGHLVFRSHEQDGAVVMEALTRSWPPAEPMCLRWVYPLWKPAPDLDPAALRRAKPPDKRRGGGGINRTPKLFAERFIGEKPRKRTAVIERARAEAGMSLSQAKSMLDRALDAGAAFEHQTARYKPIIVSTKRESLYEPHPN